MEPGATVTLQPGLQLLMGSEVYLNLRRAPMRALGTAAKPIVMKAASAAKRWSGIFITAAGVGSEFQHCRISGAGASGAAGLMAEGVPGAAGVTIANCSFTDSAGPGLYLKSSGAAISHTTLRSLKGGGLVLAGASRGVFANGVIQGNSQPGVYLTGTSTLTLTPNNVISGNRSYDVVNQTRSNINATRNYWGTASATTIAKHIFDGKDNSRFGVVRFTPILSAVPTGGASATAAGVAITSAAAAPLASGAVQVTYTLSAPAQVRARVMNIAGRPIRTVAAQQEAAAGANTLLWDGRSDAGVAVPNGAYFVELLAQTADGAQARVLASAHLNR
jgi:hypothetical protein